jgi:outer membrane protein
LTRKAIEAANENYQMASKRFQLHLAPNQEVLDALDRLSKAEANRNQALADYKLSLSNLYATMGLRNDTLLPEGN